MTYLQKKKLAFMSLANKIKGVVRRISGIPPLTLYDCVDAESMIDYSIMGDGVGDYDEYTKKYKIPVVYGLLLNYLKYKEGYFINSSGIETSDVTYKYSENYIPVLPNTTYRIMIENDTAISSNSLTIPFYDDNKNFISRISLGTFSVLPKIGEFTTPNKCSYLRFSLPARRNYDVILYNLDNTTNIYLDKPLTAGESINYKKDALPRLSTIKGTTIYCIDTSVQPSKMEATYYSTSKE